MTRSRVEFRVSFIPPPGATAEQMRYYVEDAVSCMKGCLKPPGVDDLDPDGNPMFGLDGDTVRVVRVRKAGGKATS